MPIHPYDDERIMAGQGTAALELIEDAGPLDLLLVCVGGGGLIAGCSTAAKALLPDVRVIGVEPEVGDDVKRSLEAGERVRIPVPPTIADGQQLPTPGELTFAVIKERVDDVVLASDPEIVDRHALPVRAPEDRRRAVAAPARSPRCSPGACPAREACGSASRSRAATSPPSGSRSSSAAPSIAPMAWNVLILGGGFGGLYAARKLERELPPQAAKVTIVTDVNFMLYTPLLPGAAAGTLEPRHVVVPLREHLKRTDLLLGHVTGADPDRREVYVTPPRASSARSRTTS